MMLIISIIIAVFLAKALIDILIGFAEILYGLTLILTAGLWYALSKLSKVIECLWRTATS